MNNEKIEYILRYVAYDLHGYVEEVLTDSEEDPHHSAVHVSNLIKCYIELMTQLGESLPFHDVKGFILFNGFDEEEYEIFEKSRLNESSYYIGDQF